MTDSPELYSIGQFSLISRLSVRMLRHYDANGVLTPVDVDPCTGYRRYAPSQLADAVTIRNLRDVGFGVSAMAALLATRGTRDFERALASQRQTLVDDVAAARQRLTLIDKLIYEENTMNPTILDLEPMTLVALRGVVPTYRDEGQLWQRFMPEVQRQRIRPVGAAGVIELDDEYKEADVSEIVWLPVAAGTHDVDEPLEIVSLPARRAVRVRCTGPYAVAVPAAHDAIGRYVAEQRLTRLCESTGGVEGKTFSIYVSDPAQTPEDQLITEVYWPIA